MFSRGTWYANATTEQRVPLYQNPDTPCPTSLAHILLPSRHDWAPFSPCQIRVSNRKLVPSPDPMLRVVGGASGGWRPLPNTRTGGASAEGSGQVRITFPSRSLRAAARPGGRDASWGKVLGPSSPRCWADSPQVTMASSMLKRNGRPCNRAVGGRGEGRRQRKGRFGECEMHVPAERCDVTRFGVWAEWAFWGE